LLHGVCRQWDDAGRLLGEYQMKDGTGVQRDWHENGKPRIEVSTVRGVFCGRNRVWLQDGRLLSETYCIDGRQVTAAEYRAAARADTTLPQVGGRTGRPLPPGSEHELAILRSFVRGLLGKPSQAEARKWFHRDATERKSRSLGRFKTESAATRVVEALYEAGAAKVSVPDIYADKRGNLYADCLVVKLPKSPKRRRAVRKACARLHRQRLGATHPEMDIGESHLFLSMA
jgi:hypothetical protein